MNAFADHSIPRHDISKDSAVSVAFASELAYCFWDYVYSVRLHFQQRKSGACASTCGSIVSGSQFAVTLFHVLSLTR